MIGFNKQKSEENLFNPDVYQQKNITDFVSNNEYKISEDDILVIQDYFQKNINSGILFGMPTDLNPYFKSSHKFAKEFFKSTHYLTIEPIIFVDKSSENKSYLLPQFLTMATIDRSKPLNGSVEDCSTINVIWWQNTLGLPDNEIINKIKNTVWKAPYAYGWCF